MFLLIINELLSLTFILGRLMQRKRKPIIRNELVWSTILRKRSYTLDYVLQKKLFWLRGKQGAQNDQGYRLRVPRLPWCLQEDQKDHIGRSTFPQESQVGNKKPSRFIEFFQDDQVDRSRWLGSLGAHETLDDLLETTNSHSDGSKR